jgi:hypothetical protein
MKNDTNVRNRNTNETSLEVRALSGLQSRAQMAAPHQSGRHRATLDVVIFLPCLPVRYIEIPQTAVADPRQSAF